MFKKYMHLERYGNDEVEGIELGHLYIFPKLDGTNASAWLEEKDDGIKFCGGSRTRQLSESSDNAGFYQWLLSDRPDAERVRQLLVRHPTWRLFGEWLVPHTYKGYREEAWKRFYIFDVMVNGEYLPYDMYKPVLDEFGVDYIPPLATMKNGNYEYFLKVAANNFFMVQDGGKPGEGVVIKNYDYYNKYGRQCWAKIITNEFKEEHYKAMGAPAINQGLMNEEVIVNGAVTQHFVDKTYEKIKNEKGGWRSEFIPMLFGMLYHDLVKEELWDLLKQIKYASVNFNVLKAVMIKKVKELKPEIF